LLDLNGKTITRVSKNNELVICARFLIDDSGIILSFGDRTINIYDIMGNLKVSLPEQESEINQIFLSNGEDILLTLSKEKKLKLWNLNGDLLYEFNKNGEKITTACFSQDGSQILTGHQDGQVKIWLTPKAIYYKLKNKNCSLRELTKEEKKALGVNI
jgi:WD40 repeat protein